VRKWLIACAAACAALSPTLAYSDVSGFEAVDFEWLADGGPGSELTIAPGETVSFAYPSGASYHNVVFEGAKPSSCTGIQPANPGPGWKGSCRFDDSGTYRFVCGVHAGMTGRVIVRAAPTPTPTAMGTATPTATSTAAPTGTAPAAPAPTATAAPAPPALKLTLARSQRSMRVRGAVEIDRAGSRLVVTVRTTRRVGRLLRRSAAAGSLVFSVGIDAKARKTLRAKGRLRVTVRVALTPPAGKALTRTTKVTLTRG
jgi:hypothetical protein